MLASPSSIGRPESCPVLRLGTADENIVLMLADDTACNPRNPKPCHVFHHPNHKLNLLDERVQIDYKGPDVTVSNFMDVLAGGSCLTQDHCRAA